MNFAAQCHTLFAIQLLSSVVGFEKCKWESILCYIVIATVMFLLLGFISCVFLPILNSLLDTLIEDQIIFMSSLKAKNSSELYNSYQRISGVYTIYPDDTPPFNVYCDQTKACGGWTMIQINWIAPLILTAPGMTTNMASVISSLVNIGLVWKRSAARPKIKQKTGFELFLR